MDPGAGKPRQWMLLPYLRGNKGKALTRSFELLEASRRFGRVCKLKSQATEHESDAYRYYTCDEEGMESHHLRSKGESEYRKKSIQSTRLLLLFQTFVPGTYDNTNTVP